MSKIFVFFLLLYCSVKSETEPKFEVIEEFIPKTIFFDGSDQFFKYNLSCKDERKETNIYFQTMSNKYYLLYLYDDFTKIKKDENGNYINYTSYETIDYNQYFIPLNNLTCNKNYYFIFSKFKLDIEDKTYFQFSIVNDETNKFNLSPSLSPYFTLLPRNRTESFYYSFVETKYALINYNGFIEIEEDGKIIYENNNTNSKVFEFKKDLKYNIKYISYSPIQIHFYNESNCFKYNKEDFPMIIYGKNNEYQFEINISDYKVGESIILKSYDKTEWYIKYKYKNDNKFNNLAKYNDFNYIPIKKTKNESSLILYIKYKSYFNLLSILNIEKVDVIEINSDINSTFIGPKLLFFDNFKFNNLNSFAFESNKRLIIYEQTMDYSIEMKKVYYQYLIIYTQNEENSLKLRREFFYLNSTDTYQIVIKRFNFSIIEKNAKIENGKEYLSLCQGEEPKTEFYYYMKYRYLSYSKLLEFFTPVFGNFDLLFIKEQDIKTLSDFDFNNPNKTNAYTSENRQGYLKIVCKEPTMIKHSYIDEYYIGRSSNLTSGKSHIYSLTYSSSKTIYLPDILKGKKVSLKFSILLPANKYQIQLNLNGTNHTLGNMSLEFEFEYTYQEKGSYFITLDKGDIKEDIFIEIIVGNMEVFKYLEVNNLDDVFGNLNFIEKKNYIIKVPKENDDSYYNFSIIQNRINSKYNFYIEICYDKLEFIPLKAIDESYDEYCNFISFSANPYSYIPKNSKKSDEKYFYIFISSSSSYSAGLLIKRPKLFTDINLNKINIFPQLSGEDKQYYYKIPFPNIDYDSLIIQINYNSNITISLSQGNTEYILNPNYYITFYNIPKDILNKNTYLNYYGNSYSDGYINFIPGNEFPSFQYDEIFQFNLNIKQKEKANKLIIDLKSFSYQIKRPIIYYFIFNEDQDEKFIFSSLTGKKNFEKKQMVLKVEDNGENEDFKTELEINIELYDHEKDHDSNKLIIVPVDKETNLVFKDSKNITYFYYENVKSNTIIIIIIIVIGILVLIIIIGLLYYRKKKKEKSNNIEDIMGANEKILSDN